MRQLLSIICSMLVFASAQSSYAKGGGGSGFFIDETFVPVYVNKNDTTSITTAPGVATESGTGMDLRTTLGWVFGNGLLVGLTYNTYSLTTTRNSVIGGDTGRVEANAYSEMGPTIGYLTGGWRYIFTYFISGSKTQQVKDLDDSNNPTSDRTYKNSKLSGMQLSVGYTFPLGSTFSIGPSLVYKSLTYTNQELVDNMGTSDVADAELYTKAIDNTLTPMITMQFLF